MPFAAAAGARRTLGVPWTTAALGALALFVAEPLLRLPLQVPLEVWVQGHASGRPAREAAWLVASALTAALCEEPARWALYRWALRRERSWRVGVMAGLGHGGAASVLLVGLPAAASLVAYVLISQGHTLGLPSQALGQLAAQLEGNGFGAAALAGVAPVLALPVHVALSLLVQQGFVRAQRRWLWAAVGAHTAWAAAVALAQRALGPGAAALVALCFAAGAAVLVARARPASPAPR